VGNAAGALQLGLSGSLRPEAAVRTAFTRSLIDGVLGSEKAGLPKIRFEPTKTERRALTTRVKLHGSFLCGG
jgi:hypothetical protein